MAKTNSHTFSPLPSNSKVEQTYKSLFHFLDIVNIDTGW